MFINSSQFRDFSRGFTSQIPILIGVVPFGMIYGVLAIDAGLDKLQAQSMSFIVFAGSSQFIATQLFSNSAPGIIIVLTIAVVNLRHLLYSASIAPYIQKLPNRWKWLLAYLLTDEAYAVTITRFRKESTLTQHWFFFGAGITLWLSWQISTAIGIYLGAVIPSSWPLDFTLALTFIALLVPTLVDKPNLIAAVFSGSLALLLRDFPYRIGILISASIGIAMAVWLEQRK